MGLAKVNGRHVEVSGEPAYLSDCDIGEKGRQRLTDYLAHVEPNAWWNRRKAMRHVDAEMSRVQNSAPEARA